MLAYCTFLIVTHMYPSMPHQSTNNIDTHLSRCRETRVLGRVDNNAYGVMTHAGDFGCVVLDQSVARISQGKFLQPCRFIESSMYRAYASL
jgi:hypothetical protein